MIKTAAVMLFAAIVCLVVGIGAFQALQFVGASHVWSDLGAIFAGCVALVAVEGTKRLSPGL